MLFRESADAAGDSWNRPPRPGESLSLAGWDSGQRMTCEMHLDAFRQEALPSTLAAARESRATVLRLHASAETELLFAGALGTLICAFRHKRK